MVSLGQDSENKQCSLENIIVDDVILSLFVKIDHFIVNFWQNVLN